MKRQGETSSYKSTVVRYWPEDNGTMNFYAYVDDNGSFKYNNGAPKFDSFQVASNAADQLDLMYAVATDKSKSENPVALNFRHALSQVCFKAKNDNENIEITVNSISVSNIAGTNTYNFPSQDTDNNITDHQTENTIDDATNTESTETTEPVYNRGTWNTLDQSAQTGTFFVNLSADNVIANNSESATNLTVYTATHDDRTYKKAFNLLPQSRVAASNASTKDGAYFTLNLTVKNILNSEQKGETTEPEKTVVASDADFIVPVNIAWEQGNRYIYTFNFPKNWDPQNPAISPISYTVSVDEYENAKEVNLPKKKQIKGTSNSSAEFEITVNGKKTKITPSTTPNSDDTYDFIADLSDVEIKSISFLGCKNIITLDLSTLDTSKVTSMRSMFDKCTNLTSLDVSNFDTSKVIKMNYMFDNCSNLTSLDLSNFDTSNVNDMRYMFYNCPKLNLLNLSNFDTSNVTDMNSMFFNCRNLNSLDLSNFETSKVIDMGSMFRWCYDLTSIDVTNFDTSNVNNMSNMFDECIGLTTLNLSNFDTSNVEEMAYMFSECSSLTSLDLSNFDTSKVINMNSMFEGCSKLKLLDVSCFDTSKVCCMWDMFMGCSELEEIDVSNFDTSNVTVIAGMFKDCSKLTYLDVTNFDISNVLQDNGYDMFYGCSNLNRIRASQKFKNWAISEGMSSNFDGWDIVEPSAEAI